MADMAPVATLGSHVAGIVGWGPKEKVIRPYTGRLIATVADEHPGRDIAVSLNPD